MAFTFPRHLIAEIYTTDWVPVAVRQTSPVTIVRGRTSESGRTQPTKVTATLDNTTGNYSPRNPLGAHFGYLGRNTALRLFYRTITHDFATNVVDDWGTTNTGELWARGGSVGDPILASDWGVTGGYAFHKVPVAPGYRRSTLPDTAYRNVEVRVDWQIPSISNVTGASLEPANLMVRSQSLTDYYMLRVEVNTSEQITVAIMHYDGTVIASSVQTGLTLSTTVWYTAVFQIEDQTLRGMVFDSAGPEPIGWQVTGTNTGNKIPGAGYVGVRTGVGSGNTNTMPIEVRYDNFEVRVPVARVDLSKLAPRSDTSGANRTCAIEAGGILRRLQQSKAPLVTAHQQFITGDATQPSAYWPLDEGPSAVAGRVALGSGGVAYIDTSFASTRGLSPGQCFGNGALGPALGRSVAVSQRAALHCPLPDGLPGGVTLYAVVAFNGGILEDASPLDSLYVLHTNGDLWSLLFDTFARTIRVLSPTADSTFNTDTLYDGDAHSLRFNFSSTGWSVNVDGTNLASVSVASTLSAPAEVVFVAGSDEAKNRSIGHVVVYPASASGPIDDDMAASMRGWVGELAGVRLQRLCQQRGIDFSHIGHLNLTTAMGPQRPLPLLDLLYECEDADQGVLYELRGALGVGYRTRVSMYNQVPVVTLDYASGHIAPPLDSDDDDLATRNDVTSKRLNGGEANVTLTTGRMSVLDPPVGAGRADSAPTVNVASDDQLADVAAFLVHRGTVDESRYPKVSVVLDAVSEAIGLQALSVGPNDRIALTGMASIHVYDDVSQLAIGSTEVLRTQEGPHSVVFNTTPEAPYQVIVFGDGESRWDSADSTLALAIDDNDLSLSVAFLTDGWTTDPTAFPFNAHVGGEEMTISAISGTTSPQTFTVSARSVNGVIKSHDVGTEVHLSQRRRFGR